MSKPLCIISCPIDTYSGYGARSRDFVKSLIETRGDEWTIQIISQRWGNCPWGYLNDNEEWKYLQNYILKTPQIPKQPEVWIQITVPNEFQPVGKYNIGVTAGIETTVCDASWIEGCNRMNLILTSSEHSKKVFMETKYQRVDQRTQQIIGDLGITVPIEVLFEGVDLNVYKKCSPDVSKSLVKDLKDDIKEDFCFLFVGHWLQGDMGQDRKDVSMLIKVFSEVFKNKKNQPALILKTSGAGSSIMDREEILKKIDMIRNTCKGDLPNIYLLHGEMDDEQINDLYNHPKVKAFVTFTKGEGFGRPLLEFSLTAKPVIASNWSGHTDFLKHSVMLEGSLNKVHPTSVVQNIILPDSTWFTADYSSAGGIMKDVYENYKNYLENGKRQAYFSKTNFSYEKMREKLAEILKNSIPEFPKEVKLVLPKIDKIKLPKKPEVPENQEVK
jgi:glycosyltransferase involved in cell wall biosynthesis